jgi:hypothetical protein
MHAPTYTESNALSADADLVIRLTRGPRRPCGGGDLTQYASARLSAQADAAPPAV